MILHENDLIKKNLRNADFEKKILDLSHKYLKQLHCHYLFFSFEDRFYKQRFVATTHLSWHKLFIESKRIDHCPFYTAGIVFSRQSKEGRTLFLWKQIKPKTVKQKKIIDFRKTHGIANGISVTQAIAHYHFILELATFSNDNTLEKKCSLLMPKIITLFTEARFLCVNDIEHFRSIN